MFGAAFGALYLCAQDLIGYNQFLFSNDNLGNNEKTYLLPTGASKEFLRFCFLLFASIFFAICLILSII